LVRKAAKAAQAESHANSFEAVALEWHAKASKTLTPTNSKWILRRLEANIFRRIGQIPVVEIKPPQVLAAIRAIEKQGKLETAHRVLSLCSQVFRYAVASGLVESDPTRDLRGAITKAKGGHFAALTSPEDVAGLLRAIDSYRGSPETRAALIFGILTFVRPGNLREAEWDEFFDLDKPSKAEWRIPGTKMKVRTDRPFVVPLAPQAIAVIAGLRPLTSQSKYLFPSARSTHRPMSNNAVLAALRRMGYTSEEMTGHGVRAMARTLCHEVLGFAPEVIEEQLAHGKAGPLGDAYDRTTHIGERRRLMREWADYLDRLKED
jgi:integrase